MQHLHFLDAKVILASNETDVKNSLLQLDQASNETYISVKDEILQLDKQINDIQKDNNKDNDKILMEVDKTPLYVTL